MGMSYQIQAAHVQLRVFDLQGREVWRGADLPLSPGRWRIDWPGTGVDGRPARPGIYLASMRVGGGTFLRRIAILR